MFWALKNRWPVRKWKAIARMISTGSMPIDWIMLCIRTWRADSPAPPTCAVAAGAVCVSAISASPRWRFLRLGREAGGEGHDVFLGDRPPAGTAHLALDAAFAHHEHAVADADDLRQLAGDDDDADPL